MIAEFGEVTRAGGLGWYRRLSWEARLRQHLPETQGSARAPRVVLHGLVEDLRRRSLLNLG